MTKTLAGLAGIVCLGVLTTFAQAAPLSGNAQTNSTAAASNVIQVHGWHPVTCQRDRGGWHRSHVWGRTRCVPGRYKSWWKW